MAAPRAFRGEPSGQLICVELPSPEGLAPPGEGSATMASPKGMFPSTHELPPSGAGEPRWEDFDERPLAFDRRGR